MAKKPKTSLKKDSCSFCKGSSHQVVRRGDATICISCVYQANIAAGGLPNGWIHCFKCAKTSGVVVTYNSGAKIGYNYSGTDRNNHAIYSVLAFKGSWRKGDLPVSAKCAYCNSAVPTWMLEQNIYVRQSHVEGSDSQL